MKQWSFADAEYAVKRKQTRREKFLQDMDRAVPIPLHTTTHPAWPA